MKQLSDNPANWPPDLKYLYRERLNIAQFEGGCTEERAEQIAREQVMSEYYGTQRSLEETGAK